MMLFRFVVLVIPCMVFLVRLADDNWQEQEARWLKNVKQVTQDYLRAGEAYFAPDAKHIIFQAEEKGQNPFYQMFVMNLENGKTWRVSPGSGRTTCGYFHPSGKKILFSSSHADPDALRHQAEEFKQREADEKAGIRRRYKWDFDPYMSIYEADLDGGGLRALTKEKGYNAEASYSADGKWIVFCSNRDGNLELYIMTSNGDDVRKLTNAPGCYNGGPFFSPDGKRVIFRSDRKKKDALQIYVINIDGTHEHALTDTEGVNWGPYWHPDGKHIIYAGADHSNPMLRPNYDLYLMNVETRKTQRVTYCPASDVLPVFSPDGKRLMWTSGRNSPPPAGAQVFLADFTWPK